MHMKQDKYQQHKKRGLISLIPKKEKNPLNFKKLASFIIT